MDGGTGTLPGGYWDERGELHRTVALRPLTGHDEEMLTAAADGPTRAALVTTLLSRCLTRLGDLDAVPDEVARRLLVGDRDYLLLRLRQLTFGDQVHADLHCPWPGCGRQVSIVFAVSDIPVHEPPHRAPRHRVALSEAAAPGGRVLDVRLPDGSDQEALASWAARAEGTALSALLRRCVLSSNLPGDDCVGELSPRARAEVEAELERLSPSVERTLETVCAECGRTFSVPVDVTRFFFGPLRTDAALLYREVHHLALRYHWSEPEILGMSRAKRQVYLDLLAEETERTADGH
jgi:hypothetical protein